MHAFILQDWTTIRGAASLGVTQSEDCWLDLSPYQDVIFWVDCREFTGTTPQISMQTSPSKDESLFTSIVAPISFATSLQIYKVLLASATTPVARYVRWTIAAPSGAWDATFRILVAANSPGM